MARKFYIEDNEVLPAIKFAENQPTGFTLITNESLIHDLMKTQYVSRSEDGLNYYNNFRTDRYIDIINGVYTDNEVFELENHLKDLGIEIVSGNWLTAKNTLSGLTLAGIFTQQMKDEITAFVDTYILNNY